MNSRMAIDGGAPVRASMLPYGRQWIDETDIQSVVEVLRGDWLTTGPKVQELERAFARAVGASHAVAVSSGTAALHAAVHALGIGPGDEVIVPALTFVASANCVVYQGAKPVFADVDPKTLLIDPTDVKAKITPHTRAIIAVDYAGQPCDYERLRALARAHGLAIVADACHSLGAAYKGSAVGRLADLSVFSLHPVKAITTAEGGMVTTHRLDLAQTMRRFRNHGVTSEHFERDKQGSWFYEMADLGYNYRLNDLQCALGLSQLAKLPTWIERRREIARRYAAKLSSMPQCEPLFTEPDRIPAYHLYVIRLNTARLSVDRRRIFAALRAEGIGVNVHYVPVHLHPFYRKHFQTAPGLCPVSEAAYESILSLPIFPRMTDKDADDVVQALQKVLNGYDIETRSAAVAGAR